MPSFSSSSTLLLTLAVILVLARPAHAFGAGNIASISAVEGVNWRHGDIEDTLLAIYMSRAAGGKKFDKMNVARVYFGNWLRDYSQAIDVGTVKYVSAEAIRILLWVLGFMTFGYGTGEFEVTAERLGCYRPEDHIDNPKDYADNIDARHYDRRLRGPVDERVELAIDPQRGLKNYIASEEVGITTSAGHVRRLLQNCIHLGRSFNRSRDKAELYEDFSAHSNYTELVLIEMGERGVFPHVGRNTYVALPGVHESVWPIVTGTFGGVDFLHSVMGEFSDKATQNEIAALEGTMEESSQADSSFLKELLSKVPSGIFGSDEAGKADEIEANAHAAQQEALSATPKEPEEFTRQMQKMARDIYPIIQWHDEVMQSIAKAVEKIPILPDLIENIQDQISIYVFSLIAPFVLPLIEQIKTELNEGSSEIIQSSKDKQLIVFYEDDSSDPTHSMLSKDHFSNILNEPAQVLLWAVPQIIQCWDDENIDPTRTINRIINGVFHHPAQRHMGEDGARDGRQIMFQTVERWWHDKSEEEKDIFRDKLSRDGVMEGRNHKEGVEDCGHGCGQPLKMKKQNFQARDGPAANLVGNIMDAALQGGGGGGPLQQLAGGNGPLGGILGAVGAGFLANKFGNSRESDDRHSNNQSYGDYNSSSNQYQQSYGQNEYRSSEYEQSQYQQNSYGQNEYRPSEYEQSEYQQSSYGQNEYRSSEHEQSQYRQPEYGSRDAEEDERQERWEKKSHSSSRSSSSSEKKYRPRHSGDYEREEQPDYGNEGYRYAEPPREEYYDGERQEEYRESEYENRDEGGGGGWGF